MQPRSDLLNCAESCEVLHRRLSQPSVYSSREPVRRSLHKVLGKCEHIASTFETAREEDDVMQANFSHRVSTTFWHQSFSSDQEETR
jgi:hypothetical protein